MGNAVIPMVSSIVELGMRAFAAIYLAARLGYVGICYASPIAWIGGSAVVSLGYFWVIRRTGQRYLYRRTADVNARSRIYKRPRRQNQPGFPASADKSAASVRQPEYCSTKAQCTCIIVRIIVFQIMRHNLYRCRFQISGTVRYPNFSQFSPRFRPEVTSAVTTEFLLRFSFPVLRCPAKIKSTRCWQQKRHQAARPTCRRKFFLPLWNG